MSVTPLEMHQTINLCDNKNSYHLLYDLQIMNNIKTSIKKLFD